MIKFIKTRDDKDKYSLTTVKMTLPAYVTLDDLCEEFLNFVRACGYVIPSCSRLEIIDEDEQIQKIQTYDTCCGGSCSSDVLTEEKDSDNEL